MPVVSLSRRLAFRTLVRRYGCDLCYTPMVVAADFVRSAKARDSEFTTNRGNSVKYTAAFLECYMYQRHSGLYQK